jgi:hypothetical protein
MGEHKIWCYSWHFWLKGLQNGTVGLADGVRDGDADGAEKRLEALALSSVSAPHPLVLHLRVETCESGPAPGSGRDSPELPIDLGRCSAIFHPSFDQYLR